MKSKIDNCPLCGRNTPHEHIVSNALEPGEHSTYEELLAEVERYENAPPTWAELSNLQAENEGLRDEKRNLIESLNTCLRLATDANYGETGVSLGLIRMECHALLGTKGYEGVLADIEAKRRAMDRLTDAVKDVVENLKKADEWNNGASKFMDAVLKGEITRLERELNFEDIE